ncbi:alpha/beta hydrolase fold domain-containing protein [Kibdelosporangium phytohabitans]|uniref:alpha/beta hydrolase fold domain-containing protein n=1 Tax=Kibdelosporangium phytohabitans TaxID=860235 RepID=UPI000AE6201D
MDARPGALPGATWLVRDHVRVAQPGRRPRRVRAGPAGRACPDLLARAGGRRAAGPRLHPRRRVRRRRRGHDRQRGLGPTRTSSASSWYRLAPETPFPGPLEDCYAALVWTANKASELGIDPARIGVAGESAGGGLTAGTVLLARDRGGPAVALQDLGIPEIDDRLGTGSMRAYTDTPLWNYPDAVFSWVVTVCLFDPLRDEGIEYARRLAQAGVPTGLHAYAGTFHGSSMITEAPVTKRMAADQLEDLRRGLRI